MYVNKDVYEYMADFLDHKTVLNMFSVNRKFGQDIYFERYMRKKYPLLIPFLEEQEKYTLARSRNENIYKSFFMRFTHYIYKLEKYYGIPYIPTKGYNPIDIAMYAVDKHGIAMIWAAEGGHLHIVKLMTEKGVYKSNVFSEALEWAASNNHSHVVDYLIQERKRIGFL